MGSAMVGGKRVAVWLHKSFLDVRKWVRVGQFFGTLCWCLWKQCNIMVFNSGSNVGGCIVEQARRLSVGNSRSILELCAIKQRLVLKEPQVIAWPKSSAGRVKMNTDSARSLHSDGAAAGNVVRDHQGHWLARFICNIGLCSILEAEVWGLHDELVHAWEMVAWRFILELDSKAVIQVLGDC
ncbi:hypothetical protein J1N35_044317 [Gossypium stocksii]|uniref:RNase H type-1 domain-containing protein n=1 Tax=Gossypium stocksii TaxID=47602 RepID=A0A9D3U8X0_9ROSI|nr:hypothetical protein J1N35_044317 [Gossypium stocksii]